MFSPQNVGYRIFFTCNRLFLHSLTVLSECKKLCLCDPRVGPRHSKKQAKQCSSGSSSSQKPWKSHCSLFHYRHIKNSKSYCCSYDIVSHTFISTALSFHTCSVGPYWQVVAQKSGSVGKSILKKTPLWHIYVTIHTHTHTQFPLLWIL